MIFFWMEILLRIANLLAILLISGEVAHGNFFDSSVATVDSPANEYLPNFSLSLNSELGFGCEITGISLETLTVQDFHYLHNGLLQCKVVLIKGQGSFSIEAQRQFSKRFGPLITHATAYSGYNDVILISEVDNTHLDVFSSSNSW